MYPLPCVTYGMATWDQHYQHFDKKNLPPAATLRKALELFENESPPHRQSIDLGCGTGIDTWALLLGGWQVLAIDREQSAIDKLANPASDASVPLATRCQEFASLEALPTSGLVNASFSLPFCAPDQFAGLWAKINQALVPGGRFAGHLFGPNDDWHSRPDMTFHSTAQARALFAGFELEVFKEVDEMGKTVAGTPKHWHVFHIVARKK